MIIEPNDLKKLNNVSQTIKKISEEIYTESKTHEHTPYSNTYFDCERAYSNIDSKKLEYYGFGYRVNKKSKEMKKYVGPTGAQIGYSTENKFGGSWLKEKTSTPLSTKGIHDCVLLNLVNENSKEQMLYHVSPDSSPNIIKKLINKEFPRFTKVNIMLGDQINTKNTLGKALIAIEELNPTTKKEYYHAMADTPEIVAVNGNLEYIENETKQDMSFKIVNNQYHY